MLERPRLKAHLTVAAVPPDEVFLVGEDRYFLVEGRAAVQVAPLLDGTRTVAEIALALSGALSLGQVMGAIASFDRAGHLVEGDGLGPAEAARWDAAGIAASTARERLAATAVELVAVGDVRTEAVAETLAASGLGLGPGLPVVLTDDHLRPELGEVNARMLEAGRPWVLAKVAGLRAWIGPRFVPGETACWACLEQRLAGNRHVEGYVQRVAGGEPARPPASTTTAATARAAAGLLAAELETLIATGASPALDGTVVAFMDESLESSRHPVVRRPQCPACGDPGALPGPRVELGPAPKRHVASGAVRAVTPEETLERLEKHVSPITGAISWLADSTQPEDRGAAYTYRAGHRFPILGKERGLVVLRQNMRGRSGGKGRTEAQAKVSALCEGLERYCGIWFGEEPAVRATWEERGERALDIHDLMLWSDRQYAERDAWNRSQNSELHLVPVRLERDRPVDWSTVWSLTREEPRELPTAYCFYGHPDIADPDTFFCAGDSNGQGAGNTLEEAVMQGLMELVERDSVALWWYSRARVPALDLDSLGDRYYDDLREEYARMGREVWALDITSDLGIPVAVAVSRRVDGEREDLIFGFGAHADPRLAVMRAVSEMNQFLPGIRRNPRTGVPLLDDPPALEWWESSSLVTDPYLAPKDGVAARRIGELPDLGTDDLRDDVEACRARLEEAGLELFALDQSRPDVELRVVRVMVPGLRHFWRRLAPGRLYDVPPRLGWVDRPPAEEDLNPKSVWF